MMVLQDNLSCQAYAHTLENRPRSQWQLWEDHSAAVAQLAREFGRVFDSGTWVEVCGWLHDLGKLHPLFQAYLLRENGLDASEWDGEGGGGRVNHSGAGALWAYQRWGGLFGMTIAYLVTGHHAGLPDWNSRFTGNGALSVRLEQEQATFNGISQERIQQAVVPLPKELFPPSFLKTSAAYHFWVRMLFSCLVDADFLDTEAFMSPGKAAARPPCLQLEELKPGFDAALESLSRKAAPTPVNKLRSDILAHCRAAAQSPDGLFSLTVPTGGGKTLSGTAFALDHAVAHGKTRLIYVIPYTSIIEQTADILRTYFGKDNVLEHHSNLDAEKAPPSQMLAAENWDAPVVVTTSVQFFESLYAALSSRCRKLHNIVNSVVILDEAQLLPPQWLTPCVAAINRLVSDYKVSVVLSTATQPALPGLVAAPREIVPDPAALYRNLKRTQIIPPTDPKRPTDWPTLAAELRTHEQVLCIVNRRQDCYELWRAMPEGTIHLSASMCGEHRSKIIAAIRRRLAANEPLRVISTQLVEAGVDIDFPVVYRALAGMDSIAQAAGRCNREGKRDGLGVVHVFVPPKPSPAGLLLKGEQVTKSLIASSDFLPDAPETFTRYFEKYYESVNETGKEWLDENLLRDAGDGQVQFRHAAETFQMIDESTSILVRFGESEQWIEQLRHAGPTRELMRRLQRYTVSVHPNLARSLRERGHIEEMHPGIFVQTFPGLYRQETGLDLYSETLPIKDLMV
ncbi:MAG: CRISPR-associated endonuclease Cas3'' [Chthoniobacteraceae bacterium]